MENDDNRLKGDPNCFIDKKYHIYLNKTFKNEILF